MYLVEILLPATFRGGAAVPRAEFDRVRDEMVARFGGVTAHLRQPATGLWEDAAGSVHRDEVVTFEIMTEAPDTEWWARYREELERRFTQLEVVIRGWTCDRL